MRGAVIPTSVHKVFSYHLHIRTWPYSPTPLRANKKNAELGLVAIRDDDMDSFVSKVFEKFKNRLESEAQITDQVFCFIESDRELMKAYLDLVAQIGNLREVNSNIAQQIAAHYGLKNSGKECKKPKSLLIQSYTILEK